MPLSEVYRLDKTLCALIESVEQSAAARFTAIDKNAELCAMRVLSAFAEHRVSAAHLSGTTGYGYDDRGRDTLDAIYASVFGAEDALVRHSFSSGTQTLCTALFALLRPGDTLLSVTGGVYDTLQSVISGGAGSLAEFGVKYRELPLTAAGHIDLPAACAAAGEAKVAYIQRSRGYSTRAALGVREIGEAARALKAANPRLLVLVDNCYGEFVEDTEPTALGCDLMAGSLIKNPGGGLARSGGYLAGRHELIELAAARHTAPGIGREAGCTLDELRSLYMGFLLAPTVVASALKTAVLAAGVFGALGFSTSPGIDEPRGDIIQMVELGTPEGLCAFCRGIQAGAPVDSFVAPEPWAMPGYADPVIMAAGAFTLGSSIELSADGPLRPPYAAWMQGGLTYPLGKAGVALAAARLLEGGLGRLP